MRSYLRRALMTVGLLVCLSTTACDIGVQFRDAIVDGIASYLGTTTTEILNDLYPGPSGN
ncbi:MAG: hypothetical protein J5J06_05360 [Phycisphaerae bacterium]|nr:hypothetical protein [Phycisphaerae bacterium]